MNVVKILRNLRNGLWFIPLVYGVGGLILHFVTSSLDTATSFELIPISVVGGPDAALGILGAVAASMISLVATVLSITMVVVQLAMGQFSPRIVQTFLQDRPSQHAIGLFVATFVHSMLTMRQVLVSEDEPSVPGISVAVTFLLVVVNVVVLVVYIHHIGRELQVSSLIELVGRQTRSLLDERYPDRLEGLQPTDPHLVTASRSGVLARIDRDELVDIAREADCRIDLIPAVGQYVPVNSPLARLTDGGAASVDPDRVREAVILSLERTLEEDVAYGLRMLVDMGLRALADSSHADPTTVVQVLDRVHDLLRQLSRRALPDGVERDDAGEVRLTVPSMDWTAYVRLGFEELTLVGAGSPQIARRLRAALEDLLDYAPESRHEPVKEQLDQLTDSIEDAYAYERVRRLADRPDAQGIGVAAGEVQVEEPTR